MAVIISLRAITAAAAGPLHANIHSNLIVSPFSLIGRHYKT